MKRISATEANRSFSKLLASVRKGKPAEITVRGEVVARLEPVSRQDRASDEERRKDWETFMEHLRSQPVINIPRGTRDELYDDEK
ncbi:MAG: type II toxin-antitoxin system prevent-host-death family antitoxin [Hyphomicrobiales bacterium]